MKAALWIAIASLGSVLAAAALVERDTRADIALGMAGPLVAVAASWVMTERAYRQDPVRVTAVTMGAFAAKMVFFGVYVAAVVKLVGVHPVPFVVSFTCYFVGLYLMEAVLMRRLFTK
jgi:hypothetical protein